MADLTASQREWVRDQIGTREPPTNNDLDTHFTRQGTVSGVALVVQSRRLADLRSAPATFAVSGEYSQSTAANIKSLEEQVAQLQGWHQAELDGTSFEDLLELMGQSIVRIKTPTLPRYR